MFVRRKVIRGTPYFAIVENARENGKVKQRIVASLGQSPELLPAIASHWHWWSSWSRNAQEDKPDPRWGKRWFRKDRALTRRRHYPERYARLQKRNLLNGNWETYYDVTPEPADSRPFRMTCDWARERERWAIKAAREKAILDAIDAFAWASSGLSGEEWGARRNEYLTLYGQIESAQMSLFMCGREGAIEIYKQLSDAQRSGAVSQMRAALEGYTAFKEAAPGGRSATDVPPAQTLQHYTEAPADYDGAGL